MRVLHTSDWHLGRSLHRADLRDAQAAFETVQGIVPELRKALDAARTHIDYLI